MMLLTSKIKFVLLLSLQLALCFHVDLGEDPCLISCANNTAGDLIADPHNCTQYYYCLQGGAHSAMPIPCEDNHIFDPVKGECVFGSICITACPSPKCDLYCPGKHGYFINHPTDCHVYFTCLPDGQIVPGECEDNQFFNVASQRCSDDRYMCCDCATFCEEPNTQVPDVTDCHNYFICDADMNLIGPLTCSDDEVYDPVDGLCSETANCYEPCNASWWSRNKDFNITQYLNNK